MKIGDDARAPFVSPESPTWCSISGWTLFRRVTRHFSISQGYKLALNGFVTGSGLERLVPDAKFLKADVTSTDAPAHAALIKRFPTGAVRLIAAKPHLPLSNSAEHALLGRPGAVRSVLDAVIAYETGAFDQAAATARDAGLPETMLPQAYTGALGWARELSRALCQRVGPHPDPVSRLCLRLRRFPARYKLAQP